MASNLYSKDKWMIIWVCGKYTDGGGGGGGGDDDDVPVHDDDDVGCFQF